MNLDLETPTCVTKNRLSLEMSPVHSVFCVMCVGVFFVYTKPLPKTNHVIVFFSNFVPFNVLQPII